MKCRLCSAPLANQNASGFCTKCSRKHGCQVCGGVKANCNGRWCEDCREASRAIAAALKDVEPEEVRIPQMSKVLT